MSKLQSKHSAEVIQALAKALKEKKILVAPDWSTFVKTGVHKQRPPVDADWWYVRGAAVLRTVALRGPIGVSTLRTKYGGRKNLGVKPEHHRKASGSILRKLLQQLEKAKLIKQEVKGVHKGRILTKEGKAFLDTL